MHNRRHSRKFIDLTGAKIGRWKVQHRAPSIIEKSGNRRTMWNCVCRCGYRMEVRSEYLTTGRSLSCGCYRSDVLRGTRKSKKYGRWTVLAKALDHITPSGRRHKQWACRCTCGVEKDVLGTNLRQGLSRSCGCLRREILAEARRQARLRRQQMVQHVD